MHRLSGFLLCGLLGLTLTTAVLGADSGNSIVKRLFEKAAKDAVKRSTIPVYVPVSIRSLDAAAKDGCAFAHTERGGFEVAIYGSVTEYGKTEPLPCQANNAALLAAIHGESKPMPDLSRDRYAQEVTLQSGAAGWFIPVSCGVSCAPATLYWQTDKASYWLQMTFRPRLSPAEQRKELLDTANSLVLVPRER